MEDLDQRQFTDQREMIDAALAYALQVNTFGWRLWRSNRHTPEEFVAGAEHLREANRHMENFIKEIKAAYGMDYQG